MIPTWLVKYLSELPVAAAQKEKFETEILLLKAEHKREKEELQSEIRTLRAQVDPVIQENKQLHMAVKVLEQKLKEKL